MVRAGGPLASILGVLLCGAVFAVPISLMTAELSTMFPSNGGLVLWVQGAFGSAGGNLAGYLQFVSTAVDAALYPGLFVTYLSELTNHQLSVFEARAVQASAIVAVMLFTLCGISSVGHGTLAMIVFLLAPFASIAAVSCTGIWTGTTITGWGFDTRNWLDVTAQPDWSTFLLVLVWNMGMWDTASVCSGEVKNISKDMPLALYVTIVVVTANYIIPILVFSALDGEYENYSNGYYISVAKNVGGPWWGHWMAISQCVSVLGLFLSAVIKNAWTLCGMAEQGLLPLCFSWKLRCSGAPFVAILVTQAITAFMTFYGGFEAVLACDMLLYVISLFMEIGAIIYLRLDKPDLPRPYRIPVDEALLITMFVPSILVGGFVFASATWADIALTMGFLAIGVTATAAREWKSAARHAGVGYEMHDAEAHSSMMVEQISPRTTCSIESLDSVADSRNQ